MYAKSAPIKGLAIDGRKSFLERISVILAIPYDTIIERSSQSQINERGQAWQETTGSGNPIVQKREKLEANC